MSSQSQASLDRARVALEEVPIPERLAFLASEVERWMPGYRGTAVSQLLKVYARWAERGAYPWPIPAPRQSSQ